MLRLGNSRRAVRDRMKELPQPSRIHHIDGIRGILALMVAASHFYGSITGYSPDRPLIGASLAVDFFFLLSGYVLTHQLNIKPVTYQIHIFTRIRRLLPLHALASILTLCAIWLNHKTDGYVPPWFGEITPTLVAVNLLMLTHIGIEKFEVINAPAWSISVEFLISAFVLFPFTQIKDERFAAAFVLIAAAVIGTLWDWNLRTEQMIAPFLNGGLVRGLMGILLGHCIYRWTQKDAQPNRMTLIARVAPPLFYYCLWRILSNESRQDFLALIAFAIVIWAWHNKSDSKTRKILSSAPARFLGDISFSVYLLHTPLLLLVSPSKLASIFTPGVAVTLLLTLCILLSTITYFGFERKASKFIQHLARR